MSEDKLITLRAPAPSRRFAHVLNTTTVDLTETESRGNFPRVQEPPQRVQSIPTQSNIETDLKKQIQRLNAQIHVPQQPRSYHKARNRTQSDANIIKPTIERTRANTQVPLPVVASRDRP